MTTPTPTKIRAVDLLKIDVGGAHPQDDFFQSAARYTAYLGGVGIGKTLVMVVDAFDYAQAHPGSRQIVTEPSYPMVTDILIPTVDDLYGPMRGRAFHLTERPPMNITFPNGAEVWLRSTDVRPERLYGPNVARVLMDEVTLGFQQDSFFILDQRVRQPGYPHQLKMTGTPKGRNWVWEMFIKAPNPRRPVFYAPTSAAEDAGFLPDGYVANLLESYGGWSNPLAQQELQGAWVEMAGQVFPQFNREVHVRTLDGAPKFKRVLGGIDFGGVSPTALIVVGLDYAGRLWAFAEWYRHNATMDELGAALIDLKERTGVSEWYADPSGRKEIEYLRHLGINVRKAGHGNRLPLRVQVVGTRLNVDTGTKLPGLYVIPECANLVTELEGLMWRRRSISGTSVETLTDAFERGCPDHAFDALANALYEIEGRRTRGQRAFGVKLWNRNY